MKLSFLTSCMNRLDHLNHTYFTNIKNSLPSDKNIDVEFVLLNYNSKDNLEQWVCANKKEFEKIVDFKYIKTTKPRFFEMSKTKNILGKYATGDLLCWLDADNYISSGFTDFIVDEFKQTIDIVLNVTWTHETSGMCGRVVCSKHNFNLINGYDERMIGWGYEDLDFVMRLQKLGLKKKEIPKKYINCIKHTTETRFENYDPKFVKKLNSTHQHSQMGYLSNYLNFTRSQENIKKNKIKVNCNTTWGIL